MQKLLTGTVLAIAIATGTAFAQAPTPSAPSSTPAPAAKPAMPAATTTPAPTANTTKPVTLEPAVEARFKGVDKDNSGFVDGTELTAFKADLAKIDTDKDGKISRTEFAAAVKGGVIK